MIVLDKWESQLIWLSKDWVNSTRENLDLEKLSTEDSLKNLWCQRSGMYARHIDIGFVAKALVELVQKVTPNFNLVSFIGDLAPVRFFEVKYTNNKEYNYRVCWVCLYEYLSILQIYDTNECNNDKITLIKMEPLDIDLFVDIEKEEED